MLYSWSYRAPLLLYFSFINFSCYSSFLSCPLSPYAPSLVCLICMPGCVLRSSAGPKQAFSGAYPQRRVFQLVATCIPDTIKDCQMASQSGCPSSHVCQCARALSDFPKTPTLIDVRWCLVLICLSLITREIEHLVYFLGNRIEAYEL